MRSLAARSLARPALGAAAGLLLRQRISCRGITFDTSSDVFTNAVRARLLLDAYESAEIRLIRRTLMGASSVVEVGGSLGITGAHVLDVAADDAVLTTVEADPRLAAHLAAMLPAHAKPGQRVDVRHGALGATPGQAFMASTSTLGGRLGPAGDPVPVVELADLLPEHGTACLVLDIEGAEWAWLDEPDLDLDRIDRVVLEIHDDPFGARPRHDLVRRLVGDGYTIVGHQASVWAFHRTGPESD